MALPETSSGIPADVEAQRKTKCPDNVLLAIYGTVEDKRKAYDHSLVRYMLNIDNSFIFIWCSLRSLKVLQRYISLRAFYGTDPFALQEGDILLSNRGFDRLYRWWTEYSDRKNDEEDEHVADSLLYDRNHLPRSAPPPECFHEARSQQGKVLQTSETVNPVVTTAQSSTVVTAESSTLSRPLPE